jgi:hypothetical protein
MILGKNLQKRGSTEEDGMNEFVSGISNFLRKSKDAAAS